MGSWCDDVYLLEPRLETTCCDAGELGLGFAKEAANKGTRDGGKRTSDAE